MRIGVYLALGGALFLCLLARRAARRLGPRLAALTLAVSAVLAAAMWVWNLVLLAGTLIGRLDYVARMGHWSGHALAVHDPVPVAAAVVAALLIAAAAVGLAECSQVAGGLLWSVGVILAGYALGSHISNVDRYLLPIIAVIIVVSLIPIAVELWRARRTAGTA